MDTFSLPFLFPDLSIKSWSFLLIMETFMEQMFKASSISFELSALGDVAVVIENEIWSDFCDNFFNLSANWIKVEF